MNEQNKTWLGIGAVVLLALGAIGYGMRSNRSGDTSELTGDQNATSTQTTAGAWMTYDDPAVVAAGKHLMNEIKASSTDISLVSVTPMQWPNGCLGLAKDGEICTQAIVAGYEIKFMARGVEFVYRTNQDGSALRLQTPFDAKG